MSTVWIDGEAYVGEFSLTIARDGEQPFYGDAITPREIIEATWEKTIELPQAEYAKLVGGSAPPRISVAWEGERHRPGKRCLWGWRPARLPLIVLGRVIWRSFRPGHIQVGSAQDKPMRIRFESNDVIPKLTIP